MKKKLIFNYLEPERRYELINDKGEKVSDIVEEFIKKHDVNIPLLTDEDVSAYRKHRAEISNLKEEIADARKKTTAIMVNPLLDACKPLERRLDEVWKKMGQNIADFKKGAPVEEKQPTKVIITIELPIESDEAKKVRTYLKKSKIAYKEENK